MNFLSVESSNISKVGYENGNLIVEYKSGAMYQYKEVPEELYHKFIESESKGRFMNSSIKEKYEYKRIK